MKKKKNGTPNLTIAETLAQLRARRERLCDALNSLEKAIEELECSQVALAKEEELA